MGKVGFSPIIGLAVVVALALAAVFGSMSLANPAMAAIGQPADAELTERTFAPQAALTVTATGGNAQTTLRWKLPEGVSVASDAWFIKQSESSGGIDNATWTQVTATEGSGDNAADRSVVVAAQVAQLVNNTPYYFQLEGRGAGTAGRVALSAIVSATPMAPPDGTPALTADATMMGGAVKLEWTLTEGDVKPTGWEYSPSASDDDWETIPKSTGSTREYTVTELDAEATQFRVRAVNGTSPGTPSTATTEETPLRRSVPNLMAIEGDSRVVLTWTAVKEDSSIAYSVRYYPTEDMDTYTDIDHTMLDGSINKRGRIVISDDLSNGTEYTFNVYLHPAVVPDATPLVIDDTVGNRSVAASIKATPAAVVVPVVPEAEGFDGASNDPGDNTRYTFEFNADKQYVPGIDDLVVEFHEDFSVPSSIPESAVNIQVGTGGNVTHPVSVLVDGEEITLELGDLTDADDNDLGMILVDTPVTVVFRPSAGISNPTEGGKYDEIKAQDVDLATDTSDETDGADNRFEVIFKISLDEDEGGRGDVITVTGKGFKNGTTVTFMRMEGEDDVDFANAEALCAAQANSDDVASCEFTVTSPLFQPDNNYINAIDGRSNPGTEAKAFKLEPSISASPSSGAPGDSIQVQMNDFKQGGITGVLIARRYICEKDGYADMLASPCPDGYTKWTPSDSGISSMGELTFRLVLPNDAPLGVQDLRVESSGGNDGTNITIAGPRVTSNPLTVIANQRLSLTGSGFTSNSRIARITFAGDEIEEWAVNTGPTVDNGGTWSLSVDLPITASTTSAGEHRIQVEDQDGRVGSVSVTVPDRSVSITPDIGRVGTIAVVRGENFPSKNDEGSTFSLSIIYEAQNGRTTTSAIPDASGRFETQLRIPTTATIPSTNLVTVSLDATAGTMAPVQVNHNVPEGIITLSETSGGPGSVISISGEGFKSFVPVTAVTVGSLEVTPSPKPSSDVNGMLSFDIIIPGLDTGIQTIEVKVSGTTAGTGFTVTESGVNPGDIVEVATGLADLGDNFVNIWHFNNDTKAWSFYDAQEGSDLTHLITGETYLLQIKSSVEVILNRDTRSVTCVGGNCWNQIVW